jgi:hypothetical protein
MARAVAQVKKQKMSVREAALKYVVKRSTLHDIIRGKVAAEVGRPTVLDKEEKIIVERLLLMSEWGFPMTCTELTHLLKTYLDGLGKTIRFVGNLPGLDFVKGFMKSHPTLTTRTTFMIKRARAAGYPSRLRRNSSKGLPSQRRECRPRTSTSTVLG